MDDYPLIDHHCHGVSPADLDFAGFQALFSESYRPPPAGTTEFQKPLGLAIRRFCAPLLDLEPSVSGEAYVERRRALGAGEVNRRFLRAAGLDRLLVDSGLRSSEILSVAQMAEAAARPAHEVVRIESVIEEVAKSGVDAAAFPTAFAERLDGTGGGCRRPQIHRRLSLHLQDRPDGAETSARSSMRPAPGSAAPRPPANGGSAIRPSSATDSGSPPRSAAPASCRFSSMSASAIPTSICTPAIPTHFTDFIAAMERWEVAITLLHNYPFHREAAWLSEVFQNVYYDVGVIQNYAALNFTQILAEAFEVGKFTKQLFSSDAFGLSELYYLGCILFRRALKRCLDRWLAEDMMTLGDADEIIRLVATENARRIYPLESAGTS